MNEDLQRKMARIIDAAMRREVHLTQHAERKTVEREIDETEVVEALLTGEIIEDYPNHYQGPLCLILGYTAAGRALHMVCSDPLPVEVVTVYEPELRIWEEDLRTRRPKL